MNTLVGEMFTSLVFQGSQSGSESRLNNLTFQHVFRQIPLAAVPLAFPSSLHTRLRVDPLKKDAISSLIIPLDPKALARKEGDFFGDIPNSC